MSGQAASYYDQNQSFQPGYGNGYPPQQPGNGYPPQQPNPGYGNGYAPNQPDPGYQYNGGNNTHEPKQQQQQGPPPTYNQAVYGFDEAFKVEKPKWNDLWAGLLVGPSLGSGTRQRMLIFLVDRRVFRLCRGLWYLDLSVFQVQRIQRRRHLRLGEQRFSRH